MQTGGAGDPLGGVMEARAVIPPSSISTTRQRAARATSPAY
jgi:hypothetical protein